MRKEIAKSKLKIAVASPKIKLCDPEYNLGLCIECAKEAEAAGADVLVFPELTLTGATAGDLYFQEVLTDAAESALLQYVDKTKQLSVMSFIGLPVRASNGVVNAVACVSEGDIIGISVAADPASGFVLPTEQKISLGSHSVDIGRGLIYTDDATRANIFVMVGGDTALPKDRVNVIINPTSMPEYIGLKKKRQEYATDLSASLGVCYVMAGASDGESGTDGIYASPRLVARCGEILAESELFDTEILYAEVDLGAYAVQKTREDVSCDAVKKFPFIPDGENEKNEAATLALELQSRALALRMQRAYAARAVIGVSGGLDSTLALLVCAQAMDLLGRDRSNIIAITMPCFGTTERTKSNALALAEELGCTARTIDIKAAVNQHFLDISHNENDYNVVYENAQARERTQILMDVANAENGLVIGTGDLSELALGFATYNGDHMSMYAVNASVPKTLMREIILNAATRAKFDGKERLSAVLRDVVETPVSPELLPTENGENNQHTEAIVGPYELHDFFLYYTVKFGYSPRKILDLAKEAFPERDPEQIRGYLDGFVRRFFAQQFKRSCLPDGPRVTEISLSPRGAWKMPSDVASTVWRNSIAKR